MPLMSHVQDVVLLLLLLHRGATITTTTLTFTAYCPCPCPSHSHPVTVPFQNNYKTKRSTRRGALPMLCVCVCWGRIKIPNKPISKQNLLQRYPLSPVLCPSTIGSNPWFGNFFNASSWGERKRSVRKEGKEREREREIQGERGKVR